MIRFTSPLLVTSLLLAPALAPRAQARPWSVSSVCMKPKRKSVMAPKDNPERSEIPVQYRWNTRHLYPSDEAWETDRASLTGSFAAIARYKGKLREGKKEVLSCLKLLFDSQKRLARLANYAHRLYDQDTRVAKYQGFKAVIEKAATELAEASAFVQPELLTLPQKNLKAMMADATFADYSQYLREILRLKPHILGGKEEAILASASLMRDTGYNVYSAFSAADLKFPTIRDERGREVQLTQALFSRYRSSPQRKVRKAAFDTFFGTFSSYKNTLASLLSAQINANITYAKLRRYKSALHAALDANNIPTSVYHNMIGAVGGHLPLLHRYLKLRQRLLKVKQLYYYDMYPPIIEKVKMEITYDRGRELLLEAIKPMGQAYLDILAKGLDPQSGWIDPFPNRGKRSGAYMDGSAYDVHPFVLSNFISDYSSVSTMAHEMGHALHSYLTNRNQPYAKSDYSIFVAEVASTLNEAMLMHHMLQTVKDPRKRLYLLGERLESFRQTLFRQSMFAEFELALYERAERKEALTAEAITGIYGGIVRRYYGHEQKVVQVDDDFAIEWAYVPHFYYNFYVFQYVTGITAAAALAEMILKEGEPARRRYVDKLLKAGSSGYPITLLKRAGVDLTTTKPYDLALAVFERTLAEAEALVRTLRR